VKKVDRHVAAVAPKPTPGPDIDPILSIQSYRPGRKETQEMLSEVCIVLF